MVCNRLSLWQVQCWNIRIQGCHKPTRAAFLRMICKVISCNCLRRIQCETQIRLKFLGRHRLFHWVGTRLFIDLGQKRFSNVWEFCTVVVHRHGAHPFLGPLPPWRKLCPANKNPGTLAGAAVISQWTLGCWVSLAGHPSGGSGSTPQRHY